ncbi:hypothetical protein L2520_03660 [Limosilactobacillus vaginalis]|uniref:AP2-like integrase N-terminal domain-containing protein n=1 Tax=Limosilactobacillus vaginalis TaxID=1633 RepID=A0ABT4K6Y6_9LACO|nr:hypothetical protein [Limosilactobacillus vaginalis]MCZ3746519.1 hypothetical protein [Limosilactobacillus vaginalis]MCZ3751589.1 hypothetical protein [Limosilactobacillus vaginalis]MCZ3753275.1 hypothetical protein [Limosilactobacillus vaginalis]MCZ3755039.1 hypothetical protein [Limosilactobacillus vaginalis]MCZ3756761.1 hypothetical protein [Limosilactobacillus vaginalis]
MSLISNYKKLKGQYTVQKRKTKKFQNANHLKQEEKHTAFEKAKLEFERRNKFS